MKKTLYTLGILALAALSFASCQKQPIPEEENTPGGKLVTVTFVANNPGTKTGILEEGETTVSYKWSGTEDIALYTVSEGTLTEVQGIQRAFAEDGSQLSITATVEEGSTVRAVFAYYTGEENGIKYMSAKSSQWASDTSFGTDADTLVSEDEVVTAGRTEYSLIFHRQVAVNKMTLHGLHEGEKIRQVVISSTSADKFLLGRAPYGGSGWEGYASPLTVGYSADYEAIKEGNDYVFPVYFTTIPVEDVQLSLVVYTDQYVYSKNLTGTVSFRLGQFTKFNVALPEGTPAVLEPYTWMLAEGDVTSAVWLPNKGTPALSWVALWLRSSIPTNAYGWDPQKGVQIGTEDGCPEEYMFKATYSGYIQSVRVNFSCDVPEGVSMNVYLGEENTPYHLECGGATSVTGTTDAAYYTFTSPDLLKGLGLTIDFLNSDNNPSVFYVKSIEFNPEFSRGTAGQDDTVNAYNTGF